MPEASSPAVALPMAGAQLPVMVRMLVRVRVRFGVEALELGVQKAALRTRASGMVKVTFRVLERGFLDWGAQKVGC